MVTITGIISRKNSVGKEFFVLELMGGIELVQSKKTGKFYTTSRVVTIPTTLNGVTGKMVLGSTLPGVIERTKVDEPYDFKLPNGEVIELDYTYQFRPEDKAEEVFQQSLDLEVSH